MLEAWVAFPLVLAAVGLGWGLLLQRACGSAMPSVLVLPAGLATVIVVAGLLTAVSSIAPATVPVVAAGAVVGLVLGWRGLGGERPDLRGGVWPAAAAIGTLLAFGAPVLLSGSATFAGYLRLDDTATWLGIIDHVVAHGRATQGLATSTYQLNLDTYVGAGGYPTGAFLLPGVVRSLLGVDAAWIFQPYLACCGAALSLVLYRLIAPLVGSTPLRAGVAFVGAQPALVYGYSLWGGIKEMTAAFVLALLASLLASARAPGEGGRSRPLRRLLPVAVAAAAVLLTLGPGGALWAVPPVAAVVAVWAARARRGKLSLRPVLGAGLMLAVATALLSLPVIAVVGRFLGTDGALFASGGGGRGAADLGLGNLVHPLSAFQLGGIWPVGDFRYSPSPLPTALLVWLVGVMAAGGLWWSGRRRHAELPLYVGGVLFGCLATAVAGASPWVMGKALAISSPALLVCGLAFTVWLARTRRAWLAASVMLAAGVLWSNVLAYHEVLLAPRARLAELATIGPLVRGAGPTLLNEYEIYGDRHFLRDGAPQEPAEYRPSLIPLRDGALLTKSAVADIDSFPLTTLAQFPSLVTRRSPAESRPPADYELRWAGRWYALWRRPARPRLRIVVHLPLGDSTVLPWCGRSTTGATRPLCSVQPVGVPSCSDVRGLAALAGRVGGAVWAWQRRPAVVLRAGEVTPPRGWSRDLASQSVTPARPGTLRAHVRVPAAGGYSLWVGGSFARGLRLSVDGHRVGSIRQQLSLTGAWSRVGQARLSAGSHEVEATYPSPGFAPGSADQGETILDALALAPQDPLEGQMLRFSPANATQLCGRQLDWLEVVVPARG